MIDKTKQVISEVLSDTKETFKARYQQNKQLANTIVFFLVVLFILLCVFLLPTSTDTVTITKGPDSSVISTTKTSVEHGWLDVFSLYIKIVGGFAVLFAGYIGWKRIEVSQEGQITERFTRAIDQLGAAHSDGRKNLEVRLGAIYALERIAKDSPKDHWSIMEVLTAYVRENSQWNPDTKNPNEDLPTPGHDIQAIINVIGRRNTKNDRERLDLSFTNLKNIIISNGNFNHCNLTNSYLTNTRTNDSYFNHADFSHSILNGLISKRTRFKNVSFFTTEMNQTRFLRCFFNDAEILCSSIKDSRINECIFKNSEISRTKFNYSTISNSELQEAELVDVIAIGATLTQIDDGFISKKNIEKMIIDATTIIPFEFEAEREWYEAQIKRSEEWLKAQKADQ